MFIFKPTLDGPSHPPWSIVKHSAFKSLEWGEGEGLQRQSRTMMNRRSNTTNIKEEREQTERLLTLQIWAD
jgi:hypothetical protein